MATMTLPIRELERSVRVEAERAQAGADCVVKHSRAPRADLKATCRVAGATLGLRFLLSGLVRTQDKFISVLVERDFTECRSEDLAELAVSLDGIVSKERAVLEKASTLGAEIRIWWNTSLAKLAQQVEHLDSIAESLHLESDPEASLLLAMSVDQFSHSLEQVAIK
jgi:hypothetical protein